MDFVNSDDESNAVGITTKPIVAPKKDKKTDEQILSEKDMEYIE
jgi:hypothetical protein